MAANRPVLTLPRTRLDAILEGLAVLGLLVMTILPAYYWSVLPPAVPMHFGVAGAPDAWGSKWLVLLPLAVGAVLSGLIAVTNRYPHLFNYPWPITEKNAPEQYRLARSLMTALKAEMVWLFAFIEWCMIRTALGARHGLGPWFFPALVVTLGATLGIWYRQASRAR